MTCTTQKGHRKGGRCYRRAMRVHKDQRLRRIIHQEQWYCPYRGYIDCRLVNGVSQEVGTYIKYPKNSRRQRDLKRLSNHRVRSYQALPPKGNHYRRVFDYWWELD